MTHPFIKELRELMIKHDVDRISWTCGQFSDERGIYDEEMNITTNDGTEIFIVDGDAITPADLK